MCLRNLKEVYNDLCNLHPTTAGARPSCPPHPKSGSRPGNSLALSVAAFMADIRLESSEALGSEGRDKGLGARAAVAKPCPVLAMAKVDAESNSSRFLKRKKGQSANQRQPW
eukprot:Skav212780  [mRNA]  locus=scaffold159:243799:244134:+ [translate_table: standard]